jgi:hypothetical protein
MQTLHPILLGATTGAGGDLVTCSARRLSDSSSAGAETARRKRPQRSSLCSIVDLPVRAPGLVHVCCVM